MSKPLAFNYGHYETLRDKANDMAIEIAELNDKVKALQKENDELKRLNEGYTKMLAKSQSTVNKLLVAGLKLQAEVNAAKSADKLKKPCDSLLTDDSCERKEQESKLELISKAEAMGAVQDHFNANGFKGYDDGQKMMDRIKALPSADAEPKRVLQGYNKGANTIQTIRHEELTQIANTRKAVESADAVSEDTQTEERARFVAKETELAHIEARLENAEKRLQELPKYTNCTEFIEWLAEVVLNDEDWELNAVAYGEIICRKLVKLGVLEVTEEPSYYIRPSADAVQGWIPCSERLPLVGGEFLVTLVDNDGTWVSTAQWNMTFGGRWQDIFPNDGYRDISNVIAWKTLPKPYTKGDNDEER